MSVAGADLSVFEGAHGWLFLERYEDMFPLRSSLDLSRWRSETLPTLQLLFESRAHRAAARGARFLAMVAPEKANIYPEMLPPELRGEVPSAAERLAAACQEKGVDFLDLTKVLRRAKGGVDLYAKTDSHWTMFGAWTAYRAIAQAVRRYLPIPVLRPEHLSFRHRSVFGDLGVHMRPERKGLTLGVEIAGPAPEHVTDTWDERELVFQEFIHSAGVGTALVVRDSFSTFLAPFLTRTFAKTVFVAPPTRLLDDMVEELKPDVILFQIAERALFYTADSLADWAAVSWRKLFVESWDVPPGFHHNRDTRRALKEKRAEDAVQAAATAAIQDAEHRFAHNYAQSLLLTGRAQLALDVCDAALVHRPDERGLLYRRARALHDLNRVGEAIASLRLALAMQPANALYLHDLGLWLGQAGDHEGAAAALEQALIAAPANFQAAETLARYRRTPAAVPERIGTTQI